MRQTTVEKNIYCLLFFKDAPLVSCDKTSTTATIGLPADFVVQVRSNPTAQLTVRRAFDDNITVSIDINEKAGVVYS